jgi:glycosyltransferase involved in cell wall biosynthesis
VRDFLRWRYLRERNRALRYADAVTTVSPWHVEQLQRFNGNVHLIYNGYDPEAFFPEPKPSPAFTITYTGRLLSLAMRAPELLFKALVRLEAEGVLSPATCQVHWYVDEASWCILRPEAEKAGVMPYMCCKGYVPAEQIPRILNDSSVLLLLANRASDGPKGIMTTKIFEYLAVNKPILCVRSDESYLAALIAESKAGLAAVNVDEVCDFLRHHYAAWQAKGYTSAEGEKSVVQRYSRKEQAGQFVQLFTSLCK